jgi:hypothetical protein
MNFTAWLSKSNRNLLKLAGLLIGVLVLYLLAWRTGYYCDAIGFNPDFCWLLKTGEIICEIGHLPHQDPFSFALKVAAERGDPQPYIIYQWLAEVIFFQAYLLLSLIQIIAVTAAIYALSFIAIPLRSCSRFNVSAVWLFILVGLGALTSNLRNVVRPELFTYLVTALIFCILQSMRERHANGMDNAIRWRYVLALTLLLIFEANVHIAFVAHLILLAFYSVAFCAEDILKTKQLSGISKTLVTGTLASTIATLINPYGIGLWLHLPRMYFSIVPQNVEEMQPITYELALKETLVYPFLILVVFTFASLAVFIFRNRKARIWSPLRILSLLLIVASVAFAFHTRRYQVIASLFIVYELTNFLSLGNGFSKTKETEVFLKRKISFLIIEIGVALFAILGTAFYYNKVTVLAIPSARASFAPPFGAIKYLMQNYNGGRLFADNEVSDMCELYLPNCQIFIDTRFDGYDSKLMSDYWRILMARDEWAKILDWYGIEWLLARPDQEIGKKLPTLPDWQIVYNDRDCVLFHRSSSIKSP